MTLIRNAHDVGSVRQMGYHGWIAREVGARWPRWDGRITWQIQGALYARINASRWIVDCPLVGCNEALYAAPGLPFFCPNCLNIANGGSAYQVVFPAQADLIERVLEIRPLPDSRNWQPGETLADLILENVQRGLPGGLS